MKYLRYYAEFYDRHDRKYRIEIHQESDTAYTPVEVEPAADPVTIEWNEVEKLDPVRGSGATLRLISMSDRQFYDMYSVDYGVIELNVLREENGAMALFWAGTLDPELFSEPYAYADRYVTELTFVDLAVLDYAKWDGEGRMQISVVLARCLIAARLENMDVSVSDDLISTTYGDSSPIRLLILDAANFYDEDGEAMTMREVLEEVLRPFGLQITQRNGRFHLYDCHALSTLEPERIEWYSSDSMLEADKTYNNVRVRFSPEDVQEVADTEIEEEDMPYDGFLMQRTMYGYVKEETEVVPWFRLHFSRSGKYGKMTVKNGASFFRTEPIFSAAEDIGVLWGASFPDMLSSTWAPNAPKCVLSEGPLARTWPTAPCTPIIEIDEFYVRAKEYLDTAQLRISMDVLYDARSNPYESADLFGEPDDANAVSKLEQYGVFCYIPVVMTLRTSSGKVYRYSNNYRRYPLDITGNDTAVGWIEVSDETEIYTKPAWLCFYDDGFGGKGIMNGWVTNKRIVGPKINGAPILTEVQKRKNNGEYIDLPPESGTVKVEVCANVLFHMENHAVINNADGFGQDSATGQLVYKALYGMEHGWFAYKNLQIRYVPASGTSDDLSDADWEEVGYINEAAQEELSIDTIVGSIGSTIAAKGTLSSLIRERISVFSRGGYQGPLERLLIGTAYSQYSTRKNVLSGTIESPNEFGVLMDATINGKYMVVSEVMNVEDATSEIKAIEVVADQYEGIEYE